jgi:glycosyltransferase involved in cell wall biosynthesis
MISVIVPACNEADVIAAGLDALLGQKTDLPYEVILVANGCTDDTAAIARAMAAAQPQDRALHVIETPTGSKTNALNLGDAAARFALRLYCDADILVSDSLVARATTVLSGIAMPVYAAFPLALAPSRSLVTRAYGRMWLRLPLLDRMPHGIGCYATNAAGLARRGPYPAIVADDYFARLSFTPDQRIRIKGTSYRFALPDGIDELLAVRSRWSRGHAELAKLRPDLLANEDSGDRYEGFGRQALRHPIDAALFAFVYAYGKVRGKGSLSVGNSVWERANRARTG